MEYIKDPMKTGVFNCQISFNFSKITEIFDFLMENITDRYEKSRIKREFAVFKKKDYFSLKDIRKTFSELVWEMQGLDNAPDPIDKYLSLLEEDEGIQLLWINPNVDILSSTKLEIINDSISLDIIEPFDDELNVLDDEFDENVLIDVTSIKKVGVTSFIDFIKSLPGIGESLIIHKKPIKTHSSRYTFRTYPCAIKLWLATKAIKTVPSDLHDFLNDATKYCNEKEWRTSIVLSAITTESLLADIYEDSFHDYAPNKATLGILFESTKSKIDYPEKIMEAITLVNNARISAVHRSRHPVSEREAINSLYGSVNFAIWYFSKFYQ